MGLEATLAKSRHAHKHLNCPNDRVTFSNWWIIISKSKYIVIWALNNCYGYFPISFPGPSTTITRNESALGTRLAFLRFTIILLVCFFCFLFVFVGLFPPFCLLPHTAIPSPLAGLYLSQTASQYPAFANYSPVSNKERNNSLVVMVVY